MNNIDCIVYLMLENRSFDNVLGWLYETDTPEHYIPSQSPEIAFDGLRANTYFNKNEKGKKIYASKINPSDGQQIPGVDPHEPFEHVQIQIKNKMGGFYKDFKTTGTKHPEQIMQCYTPESLPVINFLAKQFAVSDAYFSSIPTQTNCNRALSLTGNSLGYYSEPDKLRGKKSAMVDNWWEKGPTDFYDPYEFTERTVWNVLNQHSRSSLKDWMVFYGQTWPGLPIDEGNYCFTQDLLWPHLKNQTAHFKPIADFYRLAQQGKLPAFSFLEPVWFETEYGVGHNGNDYHPPGNMACGEDFLHRIYKSLTSKPETWARTLLIINFDEHGGTYDHVFPSAKAKAPWENPADGTKPPTSSHKPFDFKSFGVRVPLILVSPLIQEKTVIRAKGTTPFDHTSVIATILKHFDIPKDKWKLGSRVANAPTFENVITLDKVRTDIPAIPDPLHKCKANTGVAPNELQWMINHRALMRTVQLKGYSAADADRLLKKNFQDIATMEALNTASENFLNELETNESR